MICDRWAQQIISETSSPVNPELSPADAPGSPLERGRAFESIQPDQRLSQRSFAGKLTSEIRQFHADPQGHARWPLEPRLGRSDLGYAALPLKPPRRKKCHEARSAANRPVTQVIASRRGNSAQLHLE